MNSENLLTKKQESQLRDYFGKLIGCGSAHVVLSDATLEETQYDSTSWYKITAYQAYPVMDAEGNDFYDSRIWTVSVGIPKGDNRRKLAILHNQYQHVKD